MAYKGNIITNKAKSSAFKMNEALMQGAKYAGGTHMDYSKVASDGFDSALIGQEDTKETQRLKDAANSKRVQESARAMVKPVSITPVSITTSFDASSIKPPPKPSPSKKLRKTTKGKGRNFRSVDEGAGMTSAGVKKYRKENPGSKLKTAVTKCDVKAGTKAYNRQKAFCSRSKSWTGERGRAARKRWCCSRF